MKMRKFISAAGISMLTLASSHAATILQTANDSSSSAWSTKGAPWAGGAAPTGGNDYVTVAGVSSTVSQASGFGAGVNFSSRLRDTGSVFGGNSLRVVTDTEVLQKAANSTTSTTTVNMILDGGIFAYGNAGPSTVNLAGTLAVPTTGYLGMGGSNILNVVSTLTGSGTLSLRSSDTAPFINFTGDDTAFNGIFQIGGGTLGFVTVDFTTALNAAASLTMETVGSTVDVLDLSTAITVSSFQFGATTLGAGTYSATALNGLVGNGSQFIGPATLTVVPEPSAAVLLGSLGTLCLLLRRRMSRQAM
jgi:hypothetical protein